MNIRHYYSNQFQIEILDKNETFEKLLLEQIKKEDLPKLVLSYATCCKQRWVEGEKIIVENEDSEAAISYIPIIKDRFIEAEPVIARSTTNIKNYIGQLEYYKIAFDKEEVSKLLESYFLDHLKKCISKQKEWKSNFREENPSISAAFFAHEIKKSRWIEAEEIIKKDADAVFQYCRNVLKSRWIEAEETILNCKPEGYHNWVLMSYLKDFVKERWPEAEQIIKNYSNFSYDYATCFVGGRWTEGEPSIKTDPKYAYKYARNFIKGRWPEAEEFIAQNPSLTYEYAKSIIGGKLPEEMHNRVLILSMQFPNDPYLRKYFGYKKYRKETSKSR